MVSRQIACQRQSLTPAQQFSLDKRRNSNFNHSFRCPLRIEPVGGTSFSSIDAPLADGLDVLLEIEVQGARQVRERRPDACFIFLLPPSFETLRERLTGRGTDAPEEVERRLRVAATELSAAPDFDYAVINDDLDVCVVDLLAILAAERNRDTAALRERFDPSSSADALARSAGSADGVG